MEFDNGKGKEVYTLLAAGVCPRCHCRDVDFMDVGMQEIATCPQCNSSFVLDHDNKTVRTTP